MKERTATSGYLVKMILTALAAAIFCVVGPASIPIGPVPISLMTFLLYVSIYVLGVNYASVACLLYLLLGLAGMPVFTGFQGGFGKLVGPTGGYLIGYLPMVLIAGLFIGLVERRKEKKPASERTSEAGLGHVHSKREIIMRRVFEGLGMIVATAVLYLLGTVWFVISTGTPVGAALMLCVIPFIPGDLIKIVIAVSVGPELGKRIRPDM